MGFLVLFASSVSLGVMHHWTMSWACCLVCTRVIIPVVLALVVESLMLSTDNCKRSRARRFLSVVAATSHCIWVCRSYAKHALAISCFLSPESKTLPTCTIHDLTLAYSTSDNLRQASTAGFLPKTLDVSDVDSIDLAVGVWRIVEQSSLATDKCCKHNPSSICWASIIGSESMSRFFLCSWYFLTTGTCSNSDMLLKKKND